MPDHQSPTKCAHTHELSEMHKAFRTEMLGLLSAHTAQITRLLSVHTTEMTKQLKSLESRIQHDVVDEMTQIVSEQVADGMADVEDVVMERITSMPLRVDLSFPTHPFY